MKKSQAFIALGTVLASGALLTAVGFGIAGAQPAPAPATTTAPVAAPGFANAPEKVAPVVVTPAPAPAPVDVAPVDSGPADGAPGSLVPFIPSSDPNNANGGDYIDPGIYCFSGSASTVNGEVVCD